MNKDDKKCKKKSTSWKKIGATLFNLPSFFKSLFYKNSQLKIYMYEDDSFFRSINNHLKLFLTKEIPFYLKYGNIYILITETSSVIYSLNFCNSVTFWVSFSADSRSADSDIHIWKSCCKTGRVFNCYVYVRS